MLRSGSKGSHLGDGVPFRCECDADLEFGVRGQGRWLDFQRASEIKSIESGQLCSCEQHADLYIDLKMSRSYVEISYHCMGPLCSAVHLLLVLQRNLNCD